MISIEQYRDPWLAEKFDSFIGFYTREFFCLDNFSSFAVVHKGIKYPTIEHAYQALKFEKTAPEIAKRILESFSSYEALTIAHENVDKQNPNWDKIKVSIMEELLRLKLEQNPYVKRKLLETKDYMLCEDSPKDSFWGIGKNRDGQNQLGKLWMKLRSELKNAQK